MNWIQFNRFCLDRNKVGAARYLAAMFIIIMRRRPKEFFTKQDLVGELGLPHFDGHPQGFDAPSFDSIVTHAIQILRNENKIEFTIERGKIKTKSWDAPHV